MQAQSNYSYGKVLFTQTPEYDEVKYESYSTFLDGVAYLVENTDFDCGRRITYDQYGEPNESDYDAGIWIESTKLKLQNIRDNVTDFCSRFNKPNSSSSELDLIVNLQKFNKRVIRYLEILDKAYESGDYICDDIRVELFNAYRTLASEWPL